MSTKSSSSSSSQSLPYNVGDCYRVMLLNPALEYTTILMYFSDGEWDLPCFEYPEECIFGFLVPIVCNDFKSWLGLTNDHVYFTGSVELLGVIVYYDSKITPGGISRQQLLLVEAHGIQPADIHLRKGAEWKSAEFEFAKVLPNPEYIVTRRTVETILDCLEKPSSFLESLSDERYRPGWFENASRFLLQLLSQDGAKVDSKVIQAHMSFTSTLLRVNSSLGNYFLKSPASGCNETAVTALLAKLFPNVCPSIVGTSEGLNCFVSREFVHEEPEDIKDAILALGHLQLNSIDHIESLVEAGCPVRDIEMLPERSKEWPQWFTDFNLDPQRIVAVLPVIEELCTELKEFKIPMTLIHGDFSEGNVGFSERDDGRDLIIFDREYAYIGHPFFDFHRVHKRVPENVREEYLNLWSSFEDIDRARRAYKIAKKLGWVMKVWSTLECARKSNAQKESCLASAAWDFAALCERMFFPVPKEVDGGDQEL